MVEFRALVKAVRHTLPAVQCMFCYGSGLPRRSGVSNDLDRTQVDGSKMLDFIVAVDDVSQWHNENLSQNFHHYSGLRLGGSRLISYVNRIPHPSIYYNTLIPIEIEGTIQRFKYGVIETQALHRDLEQWTDLYVAGRLQKPVHVVMMDECTRTKQQINLKSALAAGLILLRAGTGVLSFTERQLFEYITKLSYLGDVRMGVAEDPRKVQSIVDNGEKGFRALYAPLYEAVGVQIGQGGNFVCSKTSDELSEFLPEWIVDNMFRTNTVLADELALITRRSSTRATLRGLFTAGPVKSTLYAVQKLNKR